MFYPNTMIGTFLSRPNRFLAHVMLNGSEVVCHVKNTGRLRELLIPGVPVVIQHHPEAAAHGRKTEYSLIKVAKPVPEEFRDAYDGNIFHLDAHTEGTYTEGTYTKDTRTGSTYTWVNIDSQAPNQMACEWLSEQLLPPAQIRREVRYGGSRFDLAFVNSADGGKPWLMEVKGVTLDVNGTARFPDAPTARGVKHLEELTDAAARGFEAVVLFVIQMKGVTAFSPNADTHPEFAAALAKAKAGGVHILAYDCIVTQDSVSIDRPVPILL